MTESKIDNWDILVLVIYFIGVILTGFISMFASKRGTVGGFFLADRLMGWLPIGASLFASNIGSEHFIGLAGSGAASGIGVGAFELNASLLLQLLGWVFLPVYIASGVYTLPEYMKRRFGGNRIQVYLVSLSLLLYIFTKISVNLYSGSLFLTEALHWNIWVSISLLLFLTSLITVTGGLAAVLYTDTMQFFVMIIGSTFLAIISFVRVGGFPGLLASYGSAIASIDASTVEGVDMIVALTNASLQSNFTSLKQLSSLPGMDPRLYCSLPSEKAFRLLREIDDPDMPWLGFLLGQTPASIWYWCADQMMVQRVLAAKSLSHAQGGTLMAGTIKLLPLFLMVFPGMISRVLYPNEVACIPGEHCLKVCGQRNGCSNLAYPKLIVNLMPSGLRGLMLAVMLAALISDLTSVFNSASTLFTVDIYQRIRKRAKEAELMIVGRLFVVILVLLSIGWVPVIQNLQGSQLYIYIQSVSACLAPPIAAVYLLAILWRRSNETGAFYALIYGLLIGLIRMILIVVYQEPVCGEPDLRPFIVGKVHYMYFALFSFVSTGIVLIVISLFGKRPTAEQLHRLTYYTAWDPLRPEEQITDVDDSNGRSATTETIVLRRGPWEAQGKNSSVNAHGDMPDVVIMESSSDMKECVKRRSFSYDAEIPTENQSCPLLCSCQSPAGTCLRHVLSWFCGCEERPCPASVEERCMNSLCCGRLRSKYSPRDCADSYAVQLQKVISLKQDPRAKLGLRIGLFFIICLSVFFFIFFSVYFKLIESGPVTVISGNATLSNSFVNELNRLQDLGLVIYN